MHAETHNPATDFLTGNGELTASIVVARCRETTSGGLRWKIRFDTGLALDITIAIRMDRTNTAYVSANCAGRSFWKRGGWSSCASAMASREVARVPDSHVRE